MPRRTTKPKVELPPYNSKQDGVAARAKRLGHAWSLAFSEYNVPICTECGERCAADGMHLCGECRIERGMN